ncbi:MAG TPA: hypothetical protein VH370_26845 [Humisphaera sp.]|jgi:hypothetical protein|nr:hypothetical protein [Humisphaera sp.]
MKVSIGALPAIARPSAIQPMKPWTQRFVAAVPALVLGWGIFLWFSGAYTRYWVLRDGVQGTALITDEGSHGTVYYTYSAAGAGYTGHSHRDWRNKQYGQVGVGGTAPVWYSNSHPWLSSLPTPDPTLYAIPWVLVALAAESVLLMLIVAPHDNRSRNSVSPNSAG